LLLFFVYFLTISFSSQRTLAAIIGGLKDFVLAEPALCALFEEFFPTIRQGQLESILQNQSMGLPSNRTLS